MRRIATALCLLAPLAACGGEGASLSPAAERGRAVYLSNCTACHATNPVHPGALGPALAGSSRALLAAKVLRGEYPPGYTPRRDSAAMPRFPHLEPDLDDLAAFLAESPR